MIDRFWHRLIKIVVAATLVAAVFVIGLRVASIDQSTGMRAVRNSELAIALGNSQRPRTSHLIAIAPGAMALIVIPYSIISNAAERMKPCIPAFEAP